jgi:hypothetical protein
MYCPQCYHDGAFIMLQLIVFIDSKDALANVEPNTGKYEYDYLY